MPTGSRSTCTAADNYLVICRIAGNCPAAVTTGVFSICKRYSIAFGRACPGIAAINAAVGKSIAAACNSTCDTDSIILRCGVCRIAAKDAFRCSTAAAVTDISICKRHAAACGRAGIIILPAVNTAVVLRTIIQTCAAAAAIACDIGSPGITAGKNTAYYHCQLQFFLPSHFLSHKFSSASPCC